MIPSFNMTVLLLHDNTLIHCKANDSDPVFNRHGPTNNILLAFGLQHRLCCLLSATSHNIIINPNSFNRFAKRKHKSKPFQYTPLQQWIRQVSMTASTPQPCRSPPDR
jgi:hypothetical protein